ncbi:ABC-type nitrate/sulfonate/bicarbonate transport system, periplasmic component [Schinkia azotoformans MEV2011]|uniref:ABC-type nitrate/sulfonate/bicarbonate transport system, periplasmic component n=1 Tax=Schinkia azotoformans MEV2011 TaxID=1348973 RepID=A0A072NIK6_SCHAZ|nr:ABC transporter substrate-binding protein [Schinkia azotoformans]KEF37529.1 ABC-type nitrate/sulfonate/bicarbonate transport system, periplasmic component [Schinkia azotoformans MEV2011]MEC1697852.1 ABC transporter substrate-binding protein [Schinkia azotoformans]MEC1726266.1 ABC transporter substrate-binding protein [Schinkia azotoformans]MEC1780168.1 ABC transporter substrate-binding protein [Schinkia azotoformans]MED4330753.1 ABC transporter substrate-binding protein [Schinkia azotoforma
MRKKNVVLSLVIGLMLLFITACGGGGQTNQSSTEPAKEGDQEQAAPSAEKQKVTIAQTTHGFLFAPIYVAEQKGFFADEGLDVEVIIAGGGSKVMAAVIGGSVEIGGTTLGNVMDAAEKGQDVQIFTTLMNQYASNVVIRKEIAEEKGITENSSISEKINALKGLKIAITSPGSSSDKLVRYLLSMENINPDKDVQLVPLGKSEAVIPSFKQKQIDAFAFSSPTADMGVMNDGFMLINLSKGDIKELDGFLYTGLVAKKDKMESNPELFEKMTRAIAKAENFIKTDKAGSKEILKKSFEDIEANVFDIAFENNYPAFATSPIVTKEGYDMNISFEGIDVPYDQVVNNSFAEKVQQ